MDVELARLWEEEQRNVIAEIKKKMSEYKITLEEILGTDRVKTKGLPPKYRDPDTGAVWSGRGRTPGWLAGKDKDAFLIS